MKNTKIKTDRACGTSYIIAGTDELLPPRGTALAIHTHTRRLYGSAQYLVQQSPFLIIYLLPITLQTGKPMSTGELLVKTNKEESILVYPLEDGSEYLSGQPHAISKHFSGKREISLKECPF